MDEGAENMIGDYKLKQKRSGKRKRGFYYIFTLLFDHVSFVIFLFYKSYIEIERLSIKGLLEIDIDLLLSFNFSDELCKLCFFSCEDEWPIHLTRIAI